MHIGGTMKIICPPCLEKELLTRYPKREIIVDIHVGDDRFYYGSEGKWRVVFIETMHVYIVRDTGLIRRR